MHFMPNWPAEARSGINGAAANTRKEALPSKPIHHSNQSNCGPAPFVNLWKEENMGKHLLCWAFGALLVGLIGGCKTASAPC